MPGCRSETVGLAPAASPDVPAKAGWLGSGHGGYGCETRWSRNLDRRPAPSWLGLDDDAIRCGKELLDQQSGRDQSQEALGHDTFGNAVSPAHAHRRLAPQPQHGKCGENQDQGSVDNGRFGVVSNSVRSEPTINVQTRPTPFDAPAFVACFDDVAVVRQSIEQRRGQGLTPDGVRLGCCLQPSADGGVPTCS